MRICIVQQAADEPSETFLRSHADRLDTVVGVVYGEFAQFNGHPVQSMSDVGRVLRRVVRLLFRRSVEDERAAGFLKAIGDLRPDVVLAEFGPSGVRALPACRKLGLPLVVHFHGYDAYRKDAMDTWGRQYAAMFDYASSIVAVSRTMKDRLVSLGARPDKVQVNSCGVDCATFEPGGHDERARNVVAVGRFVDKKAPHLTIFAFARALEHTGDERSTLHFIGDGYLRPACESLVAALGLGHRVIFHGFVPAEEVLQIAAGARVFVQHSLTSGDGDSEGTPVSVLEASAMAIPVVSTRHGGIPDAVIHTETGFLVAEGDVERMAGYLARLLEDEQLALRLGAAGRKHVASQYAMADRVASLQALLRDAVISGAETRAMRHGRVGTVPDSTRIDAAAGALPNKDYVANRGKSG